MQQRVNYSPKAAIVLALALLALTCLSWTSSSWQVHAQQQNSRGSGGRKQQQRPTLHNQNHESTIRNILQPKFKSNSNNNQLKSGNHTSNVAIIVSSSRYWFNYRHVTNALSIYHLLKRGGITDDNIILMLADDIPCNMRNPFRGTIFPRGANGGVGEDLMWNAEIDYAGTDVTVDAFLRVLLGRHLPGENGNNNNERNGGRSLPRIDGETNLLVYLTGHGGDNFFKFQDGEELMSNDIASVFSQMHEMNMYNEILFISDTCQAFTMADEIKVPNVFSVGSSLKEQNSYASHSDTEVGQSVIDRYSKIIKDFVDDAVTMTSGSSYTANESEDKPFDDATVAVMERLNLHDALVRIPMNHGDLGPNSQVGHTDHLCSREMNKVPLSDFFAASAKTRERQLDQLQISSILWMSDVTMAAESIASTEQLEEQECTVEKEPSESPPKERTTLLENQKGMSPFDTKFIVMMVAIILCINFSSRKW